jgi:hypothetical protein
MFFWKPIQLMLFWEKTPEETENSKKKLFETQYKR